MHSFKVFLATEVTEDSEKVTSLLKPYLCVLCGKS